jgi:hypothetical protein
MVGLSLNVLNNCVLFCAHQPLNAYAHGGVFCLIFFLIQWPATARGWSWVNI